MLDRLASPLQIDRHCRSTRLAWKPCWIGPWWRAVWFLSPKTVQTAAGD